MADARPADPQPDQKSARKSLRPLTRLLPYLFKHKGMVAAAVAALFSAAIITLILPNAVRRMIDYGFGADDPALVNSYFRRPDRGCLRARDGQRHAVFSRHVDRRTRRCRSPRGRLLPHDPAQPGLLRQRQIRRNPFAADSRHDADQVSLRRQCLTGHAQPDHVCGRFCDDGGHQSRASP